MGPLRNKDNSGFDNLYFDKFIIFSDMVFFCICYMNHVLYMCRYYYIYYYHLFLFFLIYYQCYGDQYDYFSELYLFGMLLSFNVFFLLNSIDLCIVFSSVFKPFFFKLLFNYFWNWFAVYKNCKFLIYFVQFFLKYSLVVSIFISVFNFVRSSLKEIFFSCSFIVNVLPLQNLHSMYIGSSSWHSLYSKISWSLHVNLQ